MRARTSVLAGIVAGAASIAFAAQALAAPVSVRAASFDPEFQETLIDEYGEREGAYLQAAVEEALSRALSQAGGAVTANAAVSVETTIVDARPNRPTFQQLANRPGLDPMRSIGTGGAELVAVLRGADGAQLGEVRHRYFESNIENAIGETTWGDARRAIRGFARKVAREYARVAQ